MSEQRQRQPIGSTNRYYGHPPTSDLYGDEMDVWGDFMVSYLNTNKHVPADFAQYEAFPGSRNFDYIIISNATEDPDEVAPSDHFDDFEDEYEQAGAGTEEVYWIGEGSGPDGVHFGYSHPVYDEFIGSVWFGTLSPFATVGGKLYARSKINNLGTVGVWNHAWWVEEGV